MGKVFEKITSGRWLATVLIISTYCFAITHVIGLVAAKIISAETFLGMFAAFALLAKEIVQGYFGRTDRQTKEGGEQK